MSEFFSENDLFNEIEKLKKRQETIWNFIGNQFRCEWYEIGFN